MSVMQKTLKIKIIHVSCHAFLWHYLDQFHLAKERRDEGAIQITSFGIAVGGQLNCPFSRRLLNRQMPVPSNQRL